MGLMISLGILIVNTVNKIKNQKHQDAMQAKKIKLEHYQKPITPPFFYMSIAERDKNVPDGVYSTRGIRESLNDDVIPAGYSLEQLENVGFQKDVNDYTSRKNKRLQENKDQFKKAFIKH